MSCASIYELLPVFGVGKVSDAALPISITLILMFTAVRHKYQHSTRTLMLLLMLVFTLGSLAHAGHDHEKERAQHQTCEYCIGYAHLGGGAPTTILLPAPVLADEAPITLSPVASPQRAHFTAQARAPPVL